MRNFPFLSFRQLLLLAFVLVVLVLGAASLRGLIELEHLLTQSRQAEAHAVQMSASAQLLAERGVALERVARQYLVLDEPMLRQRFDAAAADSQAALLQLAPDVSPADVQDWQGHFQQIRQTLDGPGDSRLRQQALADHFRQLDRLSNAITTQVRGQIRRQNQGLLDALEAGRHRLAQRLLGAFALALLLAATLGYWLGRPLKQIEKAVMRMGENRLDQPVVVGGPADLHALGRRLDWLRLRLVELDADKARFLRHVSHELKTPLAAIREGVALLDDGVAGPLAPQQGEIVQILRQQTVAMQEQIEELLRFNAVAFEARRLQLQRVDLGGLIQAQIDSQRLHWQAHGLTVVVEGEAAQIEADAGKLGVALANLLSNAIRFSPAGGVVRFTISRVPGQLLIDIVDQGPGVDPGDGELVFEPFYRGRHQPQGETKGSGIGLSIVREYIMAHGGRLRLLEPNPGGHFRIELADDLLA